MTKEQTNGWEEEFDSQFWWLSEVKIQANYRQDQEKAELLATMYNKSIADLKGFIKEVISQEREKMIEEIKKLKVKVDYNLPTIDYHWSDHDIDSAKNEGIEMVINLLRSK